MPDPVAVAAAQRKLAASGNQFMGMSFKAIADSLKSVAGPSFDDATFAARVGNIQLNRIGNTNDAGDTIPFDAAKNPLIRVVTAGIWNDAEWQIAAPSDRFRVILGMKITLYGITAAGSVIGDQLVPEAITQQLIGRGLLNLNRSRGRAVNSRIWQFLTGGDNVRFRQSALAAGVQAAAAPIAQPHIPSESEILPHGFAAGLWTCLDAINPKDVCKFNFNGMNNLAATGGYVNDIGMAIDAIVFDAVTSGQ